MAKPKTGVKRSPALADFMDQQLQLAAKVEAGNFLSLYELERVGLLWWRAYAAYRSRGLTVPEQILKKFDEWGRALELASGPKEIAAALEMTGKPGAQGAAHLRKIDRPWNIASEVAQFEAFFRGRIGRMEAYRLVAERHGTTTKAVQRIFLDWQKDRARRR